MGRDHGRGFSFHRPLQPLPIILARTPASPQVARLAVDHRLFHHETDVYQAVLTTDSRALQTPCMSTPLTRRLLDCTSTVAALNVCLLGERLVGYLMPTETL
jgi:hypothetical protein